MNKDSSDQDSLNKDEEYFSKLLLISKVLIKNGMLELIW